MQDSIANFAIEALRENPKDTVVWRLMSHYYTRDEMIAEIEDRTEIGKRYVSDVFRIARDMIARQAARPIPTDEQDDTPGMRS